MDITGFGALSLDEIVLKDEIPARREFHPGGSAANTIAGLSKLGLITSFIGKLGGDNEGDMISYDLIKNNIDTNNLVIDCKGKTGKALCDVDKSGQRKITLYPGVNDFISIYGINTNYVNLSKWLHLSSFACIKSYESFNTQIKLVNKVKCKISFDPSDVYARFGIKKLRPILERCSLFLPNETEIKILTGKKYKKASKLLIDLGIEIVVVKLGKKGCYIRTQDEKYHIKPKKVNVIDTTGAGDAFNAGFLYSLINGKDLITCGKNGNLVAGYCIQYLGARAGFDKIKLKKLF